VIVSPLSATESIDVTALVGVVVRVTLLGGVSAPAGPANVMQRVRPSGISESSCAVIFLELLPPFVVIVYVVLLSVAHVGSEPASAVSMINGCGEPETSMSSIAATS